MEPSPGYAPNFARGDIISFDENVRQGYKILKRGGNVCVQLFFEKLVPDARTMIREWIEQLDGTLDGGLDNSAGSLLSLRMNSEEAF